ncbi:hypothetical protein [Scytonema sp. NUACC26]|uniref:hypothetical protein n=1 Tax=Scytonema sp. NUACC26 TaxID=3140176 RepID=UPI0034DC0990
MSYVSLLKNIPDFLSQPTGIAAIASLGIHGVIAFVMPLMPMESSSKQSTSSKPKTVGLVELNQAEMNRLPQTGTPQIALPTQAAILPQVPPPNLLPQSTPALPPLPPPTATASNLTIPPLPNSTNVSIAALPKSQSFKIASNRDYQIRPTYSQQVKPFPRYQQPSVSLGEAKPLTTSPIPYSVPPVQAANWRQQQEIINNGAPVTPDQMPPMPADGNMASQTAQPGTEVPSASPYKPLIPLGETPKADDNIALGSQTQQLPQQGSGENISGSPSVPSQQMLSSTISSTDRFLALKGQYPNIETRLPLSATVNSKVAREGNVEGDLVINSQGQVEAINFNDNSVSSDLKAATRDYFKEYFQNNPVSTNGKPKFYPFNIAFKSSSDVSKPETIQEIVAPSSTSVQASSNSQKNLVQRLRAPRLNSQLSQERKEDSVSQSQTVNSQASSKEPLTNRASSLRSEGNESASVTPTRQVVLKRTPRALPPSREQAPQRQVTIKQPVTIPQSESEQSSQQQQVVIKQPAPTPQATEEQTSQQQEEETNKPSASNKPSKLIQQLRQIRETRQLENR